MPVLWDKRSGTIVNNESADILRMLSTVFAPLAEHPVVLYPSEHAEAIDALNDRIYEPVNNGVYRAGFSTRQGVYEQAVAELFAVLDELDARLAREPVPVRPGAARDRLAAVHHADPL